MSYNHDISPIGGFFELELRRGSHYHPDALRLNSGCNALRHILTSRGCRKLYMPDFICPSMVRTARSVGADCVFYSLTDSLRPARLPDIEEDAMLLGVNYFALCGDVMAELARHCGNRLIVDNAQAFFAAPLPGIDTIYSPRKFFGVPDGAYLYTATPLSATVEQAHSSGRMAHLLQRTDYSPQEAYDAFRRNEESLLAEPVALMSKLTEALLCNIDYEAAARARRENFAALHEELRALNLMQDLSLPEDSVPMAYPFVTDDASLRSRLIEHQIFVPLLWPGVIGESALRHAERILPLPVDQRYDVAVMQRIGEIIKRLKR